MRVNSSMQNISRSARLGEGTIHANEPGGLDEGVQFTLSGNEAGGFRFFSRLHR